MQRMILAACRQAVHIRHRMAVLIQAAHRPNCFFAQIEIKHAVHHVLPAIDAVDERTRLFPCAQQTAAHRVAAVEAAGNIQFAAVSVETPRTHAALYLPCRSRPFAYRIDGSARLAVGLRQTGGTAHHFDVVVHRQIGLTLSIEDGFAHIAGNIGRNAVFFYLVDIETARHEARAVGIAHNGNARSGLQRIFQTGNALPFNLGFGNDADRLRRFFGRQSQTRGGTHGGGGERIAVFGTRAAVYRLYINIFQYTRHFNFIGSRYGMCAQQHGSNQAHAKSRTIHFFTSLFID